MKAIPFISVGSWVILCEDGIWACNDSYCYRTKKEALIDISISTLDARKTPKVERIRKGEYYYYPKDCDYGTFNETYTIRKVTESNVSEINEMLKEQWESDPLSQYDEDED